MERDVTVRLKKLPYLAMRGARYAETLARSYLFAAKTPDKQGLKLVYRGHNFTFTGDARDPYFTTLRRKATGLDGFLKAADLSTPKGGVLVDVGANIGLTSIVFAKLRPDVTLYAIEPNKAAYDFLCANIAANNVPNVKPVFSVVGKDSGSVAFHSDVFSAGSHVVTEAHMAATTLSAETVPSNPLNTILNEHGVTSVDFVKIDVEGFELDVLQGMEGVIETHRPCVLMEFNAFAQIAFRNLNPRVLLETYRRLFPNVYALTNGFKLGLRPIKTDEDAYYFIHDNLVHNGCVDDLLGVPAGKEHIAVSLAA